MAARLSALANTVLFALAVAAGIFPSLWIQPGAGTQMFLGPVILVSAVAALAGAAIFAALRRTLRESARAFVLIAAVVLVASFVAPFAIPGTGGAQAATLNLMHVVVAACTVGLLIRS